MPAHLSPKQVAQAVGVSEASLKRWCDKGLIPTIRTAGGHRRLPLEKVIAFIRTTGHPLVRPEILGLPSATGKSDWIIERACEQMSDALERGDDEQVRRIGFDLYFSGQSALTLCDRVLAPAFRNLGLRWEHGEMEVYKERRGCEIVLRFLHELRALQPAPSPNAPLVLASTPPSDTYSLPVTMIDLVLLEAGWKSSSLGSNNPFPTLLAAVHEQSPRLFCLSCSVVPEDADAFLTGYDAFYRGACAKGTAVAVGGRALDAALREKMEYSSCSENLQKLVSFARALWPETVPFNPPQA